MRMRGYTAEEATAQTMEQVMTPESLQIVAEVFAEEMKLEASGAAYPGKAASWKWSNTKMTVPSFGWRTTCHLCGTRRKKPWV